MPEALVSTVCASIIYFGDPGICLIASAVALRATEAIAMKPFVTQFITELSVHVLEASVEVFIGSSFV